MRILVCGGRDYDDYERVIQVMDAIHKKHGITLVIEGGARGADAHGGIWASNNGVPRCTFHANWDFHGKKAGSIRNQNMLELGTPDAVVAFPGGVGTADMVSRAKAAGVPVWELQA